MRFSTYLKPSTKKKKIKFYFSFTEMELTLFKHYYYVFSISEFSLYVKTKLQGKIPSVITFATKISKVIEDWIEHILKSQKPDTY